MNGLLDMQGAQAPMQQPMQGGLLGAAPQGGMQMPPEMMKMIQQVKSAPKDQIDAFVQKVVSSIQSAPDKTPEAKQRVISEFMAEMQK
jgi:hypothetical protein